MSPKQPLYFSSFPLYRIKKLNYLYGVYQDFQLRSWALKAWESLESQLDARGNSLQASYQERGHQGSYAVLPCLNQWCLGKQESEIFNPTHNSLNFVLRLIWDSFFFKSCLFLAISSLRTSVHLVLLWFYSQLLTHQVKCLLRLFSFWELP